MTAETTTSEIERIEQCLRTLRLNPGGDEYVVQMAIATALWKMGIPYQKEVKIGKRCRIDFLTEAGVGIEVKAGKPNSRQVHRQIARYGRCEPVQALVLVVERNVFSVPTACEGVPVHCVSLSANWGIAL
jgi:hypothetical protein